MSAEDLNPLAESLRRLAPRASVDRDGLMYQAGRQAARPGRGWPLAVALTSLLAVGFACAWLVLLLRPPREHLVHAPAPAARRPQDAPDPAPPQAIVAEEAAADAPAEGAQPSFTLPALPLPAPGVPPSRPRELQEHLSHWGFDGLPAPPPVRSPPRDPVEILLRSF
jgi:hypothetical protein